MKKERKLINVYIPDGAFPIPPSPEEVFFDEMYLDFLEGLSEVHGLPFDREKQRRLDAEFKFRIYEECLKKKNQKMANLNGYAEKKEE